MTINSSQEVVLSNLPFQPGQKVEVQIRVVEQKSVDLIQRWQELLKRTQEIHAPNPLTEEEIAAEIDAYRRGE